MCVWDRSWLGEKYSRSNSPPGEDQEGTQHYVCLFRPSSLVFFKLHLHSLIAPLKLREKEKGIVKERLYLLRGETDKIFSVLKYTRRCRSDLLVNIDRRGGKAFSVDCFVVCSWRKKYRGVLTAFGLNYIGTESDISRQNFDVNTVEGGFKNLCNVTWNFGKTLEFALRLRKLWSSWLVAGLYW